MRYLKYTYLLLDPTPYGRAYSLVVQVSEDGEDIYVRVEDLATNERLYFSRYCGEGREYVEYVGVEADIIDLNEGECDKIKNEVLDRMERIIRTSHPVWGTEEVEDTEEEEQEEGDWWGE